MIRSNSTSNLVSRTLSDFWEKPRYGKDHDIHTESGKTPINLRKVLQTFSFPIQQETGYSCGPSAMRSIIDYFNILLNVLSQTKIKLILPSEKELCEQLCTNAEVGTEIKDMKKWYIDHDYLVATAESTQGAIEMLRHYIDMGIPVLVNNNEMGGHYVVVTGIHEREIGDQSFDQVEIVNPGAHFNTGQMRKTTKIVEDFVGEWKNSNGIAGLYLVADPKDIIDFR